MSAITDAADGNEIVQVLIALHPGFDILDVAGTLKVLRAAVHDAKDPKSVAFECSFVAAAEHTVSSQGASLRANMDYDDAREELKEYDILVIPGGNEAEVVEKGTEPMGLIQAFADLQVADTTRERTLLALSGGAMFLAQQGVLQGMGATTHPDLYTRFEIVAQDAARKRDLASTELFEERYVVNNARFAIDEDDEDNPFVFRRLPQRGQKNPGRKGSNAWKESNRRRESAAARAQMRLGGLRVITTGGGAAAIDAALYLVSAMVSQDSAEEVARILQYQWNKGVVVDSIDI